VSKVTVVLAGLSCQSSVEDADSLDCVIQLRRAHDLIDCRFVEPPDLSVLASTAGFSQYYFARSFKAAFGETPAAYLSRRRIERAKDVLRSANLTVTEVCLLVGFSSLGSLSYRFRQLEGYALDC